MRNYLYSSLHDDILVNLVRKYARNWVEKYPSVAKVYEAIAGPRRMGSEGTVENYVKAVRRFVEFLQLESPEDALRKFLDRTLKAGRKVDEFIDYALEDYAHSTVRNFLFGIKKWFELNGVKVDWDKIEFPTSAINQVRDRAPKKEELKQLLNHASGARDRAAILILTSSGLRIGTLLGLTAGDTDLNYPDVARIKVENRPGRKFSPTNMTGGQVYFTWITPEAKKALVQYLNERKAAGENVTEESPLIGDAYHKGEFIAVEAYERVWYRLLKRAGLDTKTGKWYKLHLHTLRKYFRSNCVGVDASYRELWMGHKGGYLDESYFRAEEDKHLREYRKAIQHLTVYSTGLEEKKLRARAILDFARLQGYGEGELRRLEGILARAKDIDEGIREFRRFQEEQNPETATDGNGGYLVVEGEKELLRKLQNGWRLMQPLNGDKYLIQR